MSDIKKIIKGLECCKPYAFNGMNCEECPYKPSSLAEKRDGNCVRLVHAEVIDLLKEREPKPVKVTKNVYNRKFYHCPKCDREFYDPFKTPNYCDKCGQALEWEWKWDD